MAFMSDTRTNSGVDNISTFRKMFSWSLPGERFITMMTAGNLATTQALISQLEERTKAPSERKPSILAAPTMFQVANIIGQTLRDTIAARALTGDEASLPSTPNFKASVILGGQIAGMEPRLYLIYPEGNFIEASPETPFFQIGETKYGRPILVRGFEVAYVLCRHHQIADGVVRFDAESQPVGRLAARSDALSQRRFRAVPRTTHHRRRPIFRQHFGRLEPGAARCLPFIAGLSAGCVTAWGSAIADNLIFDAIGIEKVKAPAWIVISVAERG